jgi:hypothetical protein
VFDQFDNKLKKLDDGGNLLMQTTDFRQLFNHTITPQKIINDNGLCVPWPTVQKAFMFLTITVPSNVD